MVDKDIKFLTLRSYNDLFSTKMRKKIRERINQADGLIIRLPSILGLYAIFIANRIGKPFVIELVGCPWDAFWNMNIRKKIIAPFITLLTKRVISKSKYTVYVTKEFLQSRYPSRGRSISCSISCSNVTLLSVEESSLKKD